MAEPKWAQGMSRDQIVARVTMLQNLLARAAPIIDQHASFCGLPGSNVLAEIETALGWGKDG